MSKNENDMASVTVTTKKGKGGWTKFCAFWGLTLSAVLFVFTGILGFFSANETVQLIITICDVAAKVALLVSVGVPAFGYVRGKKEGWQVVFWVALLIYALGVVFSIF